MGEGNARGIGVPTDLLWRVLGVSSDAACVATLDDGTILWVNDSFLAVAGHARRDLVGRRGSDVGVWSDTTFDGSLPDTISLLTPHGPLEVEVSCQEVTVDSKPCVLFLAATGSRSVVDEELLRRDAILRAASFVAGRFLRSASWTKVIDEVLEALAGATGADRVYVFENGSDVQGRLCMNIRAEWDALTPPGESAPGLTEPSNTMYPYEEGFTRWEEVLGRGEVITGRAEAFPESQRPMLHGGDVASLVIVPVFVRERWWGFMGFDDTGEGSDWTSGEIEALRLAAEALGAAIESEEVAERLAETEATHRNLVESLPGVVYLESLEEGSPDLYISPQYEALFGEPAEARLGQPLGWAEMIHPEDRARIVEATEKGNESLEPIVLEYRIVRTDGEIRWVRDESVVARDADGKPLYWVGHILDITSEKLADERVAAAEAKFRVLVEQIPAAAYVETPEGEKEGFYISPRIEDITGYPPEAFTDPTFWASKLHPEDRERVVTESDRTEELGEPFSMEYRYIRADGQVIWLREDSQPLAREGREPLLIGIIADVTEEKETQQRVLDAELRYRNLVEQVPAITYQERVSGPGYPASAVAYVSPQIEVLLGHPVPRAEVSSEDFWREILHPDDYEPVMSESARTVGSGEPYRQEYRMISRDGQVVWMHDECVLVRTEEDGTQVWHGVIVDITDRKKAESEILRGEAILQSVSYAGERFLRADDWRDAIGDVLESLGKASEASRSYLFEFREEGGVRRGHETHEWCREGISVTIDRPENQEYLWSEAPEDFRSQMESGRDFQRRVSETEGAEREYLEGDGVLSSLEMPVFVGGRLWGNLGFDDCESERNWSIAEVGALRSAASTLGAAVARREVEVRLREAEDTHRTLIERVPAVIYRWEFGSDGPLTYVSPQYEAMFGYSAEQRLADPRLWHRLVHPDDLQMVEDASRKSERTHTPFSMEYRMYRRDGRLLWVSDEAVLVTDEEGNPRFWLGILLDITGRKEAEEELRRHDAILEAVGFAATQFLHADAWEECIDDVLRHLGRSGDASRAYVFRNFVGEDGRVRTSITHEWVAEGMAPFIDSPLLKNNPVPRSPTGSGEQPPWAKTLSGGGVYHAHVRDLTQAERDLLEPQGIKSILEVPIFVGGEWWGFLGYDECREERTWSLAEIEALRAAAGVLGAVIQRREAEGQLREAEERHRLLVEQLPAVVYIDAIDEVSTALYISPQVEDMLGYTAEERMATPHLWLDSLHADDREAVQAESDRTNETGDNFVMDYRMIARDGRVVWIHDESVLVLDGEGTPLYWQGVLFDITDRKEAEAELERALKLEREVAERLRSLDEMKNTFLTAVSHDLRTPLAAVLGLALTLEREDIGLDEKETRDLARRIATNARKLDRLVTDLLDLDRLSRGIFDPNLSPTDLGLLVQKVVSEADYLGDHPVTVEAESVEISVDTAKVERIVENLIANSVRHTPAGTRIWVKVLPEGDGALILVEDEGPGVLAELREAVFEPFRQGASGSPSPGVGIGLSLVARFAELHGGRAWVADREGGGASFRVFLPGV